MVTGTKQSNNKMKVKRYKIQYSVDKYTFPKEAYIHAVRFDKKYMHVELADERILSIPLIWIPTLHNVAEEDRRKFKISESRKMIIWDPDESGINDEVNILDYLGPIRSNEEEDSHAVYASRERKKQAAEAKPKVKKKK